LQNGFAMTISATSRKRDARRPAHLACQPQHPQPAGRPPSWPFRAQNLRRPPDRAERDQYRRADHRHLAARRRHRDPGTPRRRQSRHAGQDPGPGGAQSESGFAIEFTRLQHPDSVEEDETAQ
jgi:hypothetical protein